MGLSFLGLSDGYSNTGTTEGSCDTATREQPKVLAIQQHGNNRRFLRYSNTETTEGSCDTATREQPKVLAINTQTVPLCTISTACSCCSVSVAV